MVCGKHFYGNSSDCLYCPSCAKEKRLESVIQIRICQDCGIEFSGGPRARRCPDCAYKAQQETNKRFKEQGGAMRPIGSIDKCVICGNEYTVVSGRQKYCKNPLCQRKGISEWRKQNRKGYNKLSGQDIKKQERRKQAQKICVYCLRKFTSNKPTNTCSDYCRNEHKKIRECIADINRGYDRDYDKYINKRNKYREKVKNEDKGI